MIQKRKRNEESLIKLGLGGPGTAAASIPITTAATEPPVQPESTKSPSPSVTNAIAVIAPQETATVEPQLQPEPTESPSPSASTKAIPETTATSLTETTATDV